VTISLSWDLNVALIAKRQQGPLIKAMWLLLTLRTLVSWLGSSTAIVADLALLTLLRLSPKCCMRSSAPVLAKSEVGWQLSPQAEVELISSAVEEACHEVDRDLMRTAQEGHWTDGTSMLLALLAHGFDAPKQASVAGCEGGVAKLFLAWCGDSRGLLLTGRESKSLSKDHVPSRKDEYARLKQAGGKVLEFDGVLKVGRRDKYKENKRPSSKSSFSNVLWSSTSRSFGDIRLKAPHQIVTSEPEFLTRTLTPDDWALVLVCSGISSWLSDQEIADACWECLVLRNASVSDTAHEVTQRAQRRGAAGKLTVFVMRFGWATPRL